MSDNKLSSGTYMMPNGDVLLIVPKRDHTPYTLITPEMVEAGVTAFFGEALSLESLDMPTLRKALEAAYLEMALMDHNLMPTDQCGGER